MPALAGNLLAMKRHNVAFSRVKMLFLHANLHLPASAGNLIAMKKTQCGFFTCEDALSSR
jgi:hypothetical protein